MISSNQKKFVSSLKQKKFRTQYNFFVVEGDKMVSELLQSNYQIEYLFATTEWIECNEPISCIEISEKELNSISSLKTPNEVLAVVKQKDTPFIEPSSELTIALDQIQDPGNLGTIIRTADWFGVKNIICSKNSVDKYNPKVIQATMGSFLRVNLLYENLNEFFSNNPNLRVYGSLLEGENVYKKKLESKGSILLMGNESKGISDELLPFISEKISIPKFGKSESLNLTIATAILCSEFTRR